MLGTHAPMSLKLSMVRANLALLCVVRPIPAFDDYSIPA